jgi:hypothetical protein
MTKRVALTFVMATLFVAVASPAAAFAAFGLHDFDVTFTEADGTPATQAGSHPFAMTISFEANTTEEGGKLIPVEAVKDVLIAQAEGFAGTPAAVPACSALDFLVVNKEEGQDPSVPECADGSAVGVIDIVVKPPEGGEEAEVLNSPVYLLEPAPGTAARIGFWVKGVPVTADVGVEESPPYRIVGASRNISQGIIDFYGADLTLWGNPTDEAHDDERGSCHEGGKSCPAGVAGIPFITLPRACSGPLVSTYETDSWLHPGAWVRGFALTHDEFGNPRGMDGCGKLDFRPGVTTRPTTDQASSPSGLGLSLDVEDEGLTNPEGLAQSDIKKLVLTLPQGMTANPSAAEGLKVCSPEDLKRERVNSAPGEGCPEASKVGALDVQTPLLPGATLHGALYLATPYENPFNSLLALYMVIKDRGFGVIVKQAAKVEPDPRTGQLTTTVDDIPQFPLAHVEAHLREGGRSLLISPPGCGRFDTVAMLTPWSDPSSAYEAISSFRISGGANGASCPTGGTPPFKPGFTAGSLDNSAGAYSPFFMRLTRSDGQQDITRFDATLPPGVVAKLAGVDRCPDAAIAAARAKSGREEQAAPSCPASSQIGRIEGGAGVGSQLTYVPGKLYFSGPYKGAPLSVVAIVPAVAGPFDVGNVVVRQSVRLNPRTGRVIVDSAASDAIPHILAGIPLAVRDVQVYVDRPDFTINPTGCLPSGTLAEIWGGGSDPFSAADDAPVSLLAPFQGASCASLAFKPRLNLRLKGGTKRGQHPKLRGTFMPRPGNANLAGLVLRLPHSAFLEQAHIRTICTRVRYAANTCPKGAIYGRAVAYTPLLDEPLKGPVYLRSSSNPLPDLVASLRGLVDIEVVGRIDSVKGGIRATFSELPDAPVSKVVIEMQGGKKGLIVNSRSLCAHKSVANARLTGQNGRMQRSKPVVKADCKKRPR